MTDERQLYDPHDHEPMPEGEETAPPYMRTMAIVRWVLLAGMTLFAFVMILQYFGATPWQSVGTQSSQYHCPMHPTYVSSQPGECPICGMDLVPIDESTGEADVALDTTDQSDHASHGESKARPGQYTCPMDPEVISDVPGECPICGMNLELVPSDTSAAAHDETFRGKDDLGSAPVPGLVPVTIEPQRLQLIGVKTSRVEVRNLESELHLLGYITPDETKVANLHVRVSGWVQHLNVNQTGQVVSQGEGLLSLYSPELYEAQQSLIVSLAATSQIEADSLLNSMRSQLVEAARQRLLLLGMPRREIDDLETQGTAKTELTLRSPFSGVVLQKGVNQGQFVTPDQNLFTIADLRDVWVLADVYERDLSQVRVGQKVTMSAAGLTGEEFIGTVQFVYPTVAEQTRTAKVRIELRNPQLRLRPGMYADVRLQSDSRPTLAIPVEALMDGDQVQYAFVVHGDTHFEPREIVVGRRTDDWAEVLSGLHEGETVVTSANFLIDSESRLKAAIAGMGSTSPDAHAGHGK